MEVSQVETESQKRNKGPSLEENLASLVDELDDLSVFLSCWIKLRSKTIEFFKNSIRKTGGSAAACPAVSSVASAITSKIPDSGWIRTTMSTVGSVASLGFYTGYNKGKEDFNGRRINGAIERLKRENAEGSCLTEMVLSVMTSLLSTMKILNEPVVTPVNSRTASNENQTTPDYQSFNNWCELMYKLLVHFRTILVESMKPNQQILEKNVSLRGTPITKQEFQTWIFQLNDNLPAVNDIRKYADQVVRSLDDFVQTFVEKDQDSGAVSGDGVECQDLSEIDWCVIDSIDCDDGDASGSIDRWFQQINILYLNSVKVGSSICRLISEENLPVLAKNFSSR